MQSTRSHKFGRCRASWELSDGCSFCGSEVCSCMLDIPGIFPISTILRSTREVASPCNLGVSRVGASGANAATLTIKSQGRRSSFMCMHPRRHHKAQCFDGYNQCIFGSVDVTLGSRYSPIRPRDVVRILPCKSCRSRDTSTAICLVCRSVSAS